MMSQVLLHRDEDGWRVAEVPSLPGCVTQGRTREDALVNVREAIELSIEGLVEDGWSVPEERFEAIFVAV